MDKEEFLNMLEQMKIKNNERKDDAKFTQVGFTTCFQPNVWWKPLNDQKNSQICFGCKKNATLYSENPKKYSCDKCVYM